MTKLKIAALLAFAGTGIYTQTAQAFTYVQGDVILGFRSTNGSITTDYLIDIGQNLFANAAADGGSITIGNFGTDLGNFDTNWFTDGTTKWGVGGAFLSTDGTHTLYAGYAETSPSTTPGSTYNGQTNTNQSSQFGRYNTVGTTAQTGGAIIAGSTQGDSLGTYPNTIFTQSQVASNADSWAKQVSASAGVGFAHFTGFEGTLGTGAPGDSSNYYQILPSPTTASQQVLEGTFNMASDGTLTFNSAVPEPSTLAALLGGAGLLVIVRRRRAVQA